MTKIKKIIRLLPLLFLLCLSGCSGTSKSTVATDVGIAETILCPILKGVVTSNGAAAGAICEGLAGLVQGVINALPRTAAALAANDNANPIRFRIVHDAGGKPIGYVREEIADDVEAGIKKRAIHVRLNIAPHVATNDNGFGPEACSR